MVMNDEEARDVLRKLRPHFPHTLTREAVPAWHHELTQCVYTYAEMYDAAKEVLHSVKGHLRMAHLFDAAAKIRAYDRGRLAIAKAERQHRQLPERTVADPALPAAAADTADWVRTQCSRTESGRMTVPSDAETEAYFNGRLRGYRENGVPERKPGLRDLLAQMVGRKKQR